MKSNSKRPVMEEYTKGSSTNNVQNQQQKQPSQSTTQKQTSDNVNNYQRPQQTQQITNTTSNQKLKKDYKIDPAVIPRPTFHDEVYKNEQKYPIYNTNETATPPPLTNTFFIVNETQNSSPRYIRSSLNKIPCDQSKLSNSSLNFGILNN